MLARFKAYLQRRKEQKKKVDAPKVEAPEIEIEDFDHSGFTDFTPRRAIPDFVPMPTRPLRANKIVEDDAGMNVLPRPPHESYHQQMSRAHDSTPTHSYDDDRSSRSSSSSHDSSSSYSSASSYSDSGSSSSSCDSGSSSSSCD